MRRSAPPQVLGWKEHVLLPDWDLALRAKLDTGARTSALHAHDITVMRGDVDDLLGRVSFDVVLGTKARPEHHPVVAPIVGFRRVRDTGARAEQRPVVRARVLIAGQIVDTDVTLTDRTGMNFRMLLGRRTLEGVCVVDPSRGYVSGRPSPDWTPQTVGE